MSDDAVPEIVELWRVFAARERVSATEGTFPA
jgi:hypothetical protein